jgi:hypothetical protein
MEDPIDLGARRKEREQANRKTAFQQWAPSRSVLAWTALAGAVVAGYLVFGQSWSFNQASMGGMQAGGIKECGLLRRTCLVDGDTGWQDGIKWRMQGIDAPEMNDKAECSGEREKASASLARLIELMGDGYAVKASGRNDKYGRALVDVALRDGRDAGRVLMAEGLAQPWPNQGNMWCGR